MSCIHGWLASWEHLVGHGVMQARLPDQTGPCFDPDLLLAAIVWRSIFFVCMHANIVCRCLALGSLPSLACDVKSCKPSAGLGWAGLGREPPPQMTRYRTIPNK